MVFKNMNKLKLLFPLLGTSALAVAPALTAQTSQSNNLDSKNNSGYGKDPLHRISTDNNSKYYVDGKSDEYYYDSAGITHAYSEANLTFSLTTAGVTKLVQDQIKYKPSTSHLIMSFFNNGGGQTTMTYALKHFGYGCRNSYLGEILGTSTDGLCFNDKNIYQDFMNHMDQPVSVVNKLVGLYNKHIALPQVAVKFHFNYHTFGHDDFDVTFTMGKIPPVPQSKLAPSQFIGHFPGMGPYGKAGNQDHAKLISSESTSESLKLDLSTTSINYINSHFLNKPVPSSKIALAVMDYLHDAYPSSDWKATLAGILRAGGVPAVNYAFGKLIDFIGTYQKDGKTLLKNTPAYYYIKDGDSFTAAKNQPFS